MRFDHLKSILLYAGIKKKEYSMISPMIWEGNMKTLRLTAYFAMGLGLVFLIPNMILRPYYSTPYVVLVLGSLVTLGVLMLIRRFKIQSVALRMALCYWQMLLIFLYSCILSMQPSNYDLPGVSVIVFLTILPLTIDDRPIRMYGFIIAETVIYVIASHFSKNARVFFADLEDALSFGVVAMVLYTVICTRNTRELYQRVRIDKIQKSVITSLATVVEERDENTGEHIARCEIYVDKLLERMKTMKKYGNLTQDYCSNVSLAAAMHDIGKIRIPDSILNKPGRLTEEEYEVMKKHSDYGAAIIHKTMMDIEEEDYCKIAWNIAKYHHERYDGKGYPEGLKGEDIPLEARVMALADVYDALVSERVYKKAFPEEKAKAIIQEGSGTQFDPALVPLFLECV